MTQEQYFDGNGFEKPTVSTPVVIRAALILLALNVVIALWFYFSPVVFSTSAPRPEQQAYTDTGGKASPFEPVVAEKPRKWVKRPPRAEPYFAEVVVPSGSNN